MKLILIACALAGSGLPGSGLPGSGPAAAAAPAATAREPRPGGYTPAKVDDPLVLEAKAAVQRQFALLRLETVLDAGLQLVAGLNVALVCRVQEADGQGIWAFRVHRRLDNSWQLTLARRKWDARVDHLLRRSPEPTAGGD